MRLVVGAELHFIREVEETRNLLGLPGQHLVGREVAELLLPCSHEREENEHADEGLACARVALK